MIRLSELCRHLDIPRHRADQWLNRRIFRPEKETTAGAARQYTLRDAIVLSVIKDLADSRLSLESIATALANVHPHGFEDDKAVLVVSFADVPLAIEGRPMQRAPGVLMAKIVRHHTLPEIIAELHRHVSVVIPLDRHAERMSPLFEGLDAD